MKILIVGLGSIGRKHLYSIQQIAPNSTIFGLRSSRESSNEKGVINIYNLEDIEDIDFAIISNPTSMHNETLAQLSKLNCPLFIEKPLHHTLEVSEIVNELERKSLLTYVACNLRFLDCLKFTKEYLDNHGKKINEINIYCGSYLPDWRPDSDFRESYSANPEKGGGVYLDLIHEIDYAYWFFGMPTKYSRILRNNSTLQINACDYANYCLEYDNFCISIILNYFRRDSKRTMEIIFEDQTWTMDLLNNRIISNNNIIFESQQKIIDTYIIQMKYFIELVLTNQKKSQNTIRDAFNVLQICLGYA